MKGVLANNIIVTPITPNDNLGVIPLIIWYTGIIVMMKPVISGNTHTFISAPCFCHAHYVGLREALK